MRYLVPVGLTVSSIWNCQLSLLDLISVKYKHKNYYKWVYMTNSVTVLIALIVLNIKQKWVNCSDP